MKFNLPKSNPSTLQPPQLSLLNKFINPLKELGVSGVEGGTRQRSGGTDAREQYQSGSEEPEGYDNISQSNIAGNESGDHQCQENRFEQDFEISQDVIQQLPIEILQNMNKNQLMQLGVKNIGDLKQEINNTTEQIQYIQQNKIDYHKMNEVLSKSKKGRNQEQAKVLEKQSEAQSKKKSHVLLQQSQTDHKSKVKNLLQYKRAAQGAGILNNGNDFQVAQQQIIQANTNKQSQQQVQLQQREPEVRKSISVHSSQTSLTPTEQKQLTPKLQNHQQYQQFEENESPLDGLVRENARQNFNVLIQTNQSHICKSDNQSDNHIEGDQSGGYSHQNQQNHFRRNQNDNNTTENQFDDKNLFIENNQPEESAFTSQPSIDIVQEHGDVINNNLNQSRCSSRHSPRSHNSTITQIQNRNHISFGINDQSVTQYFNAIVNSNANQTASTPTLSKQFQGFGGAPTISSGQSALGGHVSVAQTQSLSEMINHQNSHINNLGSKIKHRKYHQIPTTQIQQVSPNRYYVKSNTNQTLSNSLNQSTLCNIQPSVLQLNNDFADQNSHDLQVSDLISHLNNKMYQGNQLLPTQQHQRHLMPTQPTMPLSKPADMPSCTLKPGTAYHNLVENLQSKQQIMHNSQTFTEKNQTTKDSSQQSVFTDTALNRRNGLLNQNRIFSQSQLTVDVGRNQLSEIQGAHLNKREQKSTAKITAAQTQYVHQKVNMHQQQQQLFQQSSSGVKTEAKMKGEGAKKAGNEGGKNKMLQIEDIDVKSKVRFQIDLDLARFLEIDQWCSFREITLGLLKFNKKTGGDFYDRSTTSFNAYKYPYFLEFFPHLKNLKVKKQQKITNLDLRKYLIDKQMKK